METKHFAPGDPVLIENIVSHLKARGIFDQFRHDSLADVDTKPSYQNLSQRVDGFVSKFLANETWNPDQNKNELRNKLRRQIDESGMLALGVDHVVEQVINPKVFQVFAPKIREVIEQYLGLREIPEENESKQKKQEYNTTETGGKTDKISLEISDSSIKVEKSVISDPISEILALSDPSKQKKIVSTTQVKALGTVSVPDASIKPEKKKDDEKPKSSVEVKVESQNQNIESFVELYDSKSQTEKETITKKEVIKSAELEVSSDGFKKSFKNLDQKSESKSSFEDLKFQDVFFSEDSSSQSGTNRSSDAADIKSDSSVKNKSSDSDKLKTKVKHSSIQKEGSQKVSHVSSKIKLKDSAETFSPVKPSGEKLSKGHSKLLKSHSKEHTPTKSHSSQHKSPKEERDFDSKSSTATKSSDTSHRKSSSSSSSTTASSKKEGDASKIRNVSEKSKITEKGEQKKYSHTGSHSKVKINSPISSSYDSSQGSDQERDSYSKKHSTERRKLFSKGSRIESEDVDKMSDLPPSSKSSSSMDKSEKSYSEKHDDRSIKEKHKSFVVHQRSKIESRSDSTKSSSSVGSTSDSSKEMSYQSTVSDGMDESSSNKSDSDKKKTSSQSKKSCKDVTSVQPPPSPPPPSAGISTEQSASSSLESESDDKQSSDENSSDSSLSENNSDDSSSQHHSTKQSSSTSESSSGENINKKQLMDDVPDVFLDSSSDEDFSYFSTPEKLSREDTCDSDVTVSSVHTSDLSSSEDEVCDSAREDDPQSTSSQNEKKYFIKANVEKTKQVNLKKRRRNGEKESPSSEEKCNNHVASSNITPQKSACSDEELTSPLEPKRESRRERKLNPKYASEEYASIFNSSKKLKSINPMSEVSNPNDAQIKRKSNAIRIEEINKNLEMDDELDVNENVSSESISSNSNNLSNEKYTLSPPDTVSSDSEDNKVNQDSRQSTSCNVSSDSEAECNYTITLKIKKSPKKLNNTLTSKLNDSSLSFSAKNKETATMNSSNLKHKKLSPNVPFVENMPNENKPDNNGSKNEPSERSGATKVHKRLRHQSGEDCVTGNLKRRKTDAYHEEQMNNNVDALKKNDVSKDKANSQMRFH